MLRCSDCGEHSPDNASFCILCGARLRARPPLIIAHPRSITSPTTHLQAAEPLLPPPFAASAPMVAPHAHVHQAAIMLIGLVFAAVFVTGIAQLFAVRGLCAGALQAAVLCAGALSAERAWVDGEPWRGTRGMLLWGGLTWLLATELRLPLLLVLLVGWVLLHPRWYPLGTPR